MLDIYSTDITVSANSSVPFNNTNVAKGCKITRSGTASVQFNKCGMYKVQVDASVVAGAAGDISLQLYKNNIPQPQAQAIETSADTTSTHNLSFSTLVQVDHDNCKCNMCTIPVTVSLQNVSSIPVNFTVAHMVVTPA